jgi:hypothetical protein
MPNIRPIAEVLAEIERRLKALMWTAPNTTVPVKAFERVEKFISIDLEDALSKTVANQQRLAYIVCHDLEWEKTGPSAEAETRRTISISVLIADKVIGDRIAAALGNDATPGAWGLHDLVAPVLIGRLLQNPGGVNVQPVRAFLLGVDKKKEAAVSSRIAVVLELDCIGGVIGGETEERSPVR